MAKGKAERRAARKRRRAHGRELQTAPGTLVRDPDAPTPVIHVCSYGREGFHESARFDVDEIQASRERWPVTWVHVIGLGDTEVIQQLGDLFGLHRLALADVVHTSQRPKVEAWGHVTQIVVRMVDEAGSTETEQLSVFVGENFVLSFEERKGDLFQTLRDRLRADIGGLRDGRSDTLAHALLDVIIDAFFPVLEQIGEELEAVEDEVPVTKRMELLTPRLRKVKHDLLQLRRALWPLRDVLGALAAGACPYVREETRRYMRDCQDHCAQLIDIVATSRELATDLVDLQISVAGQRLNEVMKVLTVMATLFIPLTFICSVYGMNFDPASGPLNMPELKWAFGYPFALGLMFSTAAGLLLFFRRRGWL
jgi:magnesium transporter